MKDKKGLEISFKTIKFIQLNCRFCINISVNDYHDKLRLSLCHLWLNSESPGKSIAPRHLMAAPAV